jgi:hypothetical protein
MIVLFMQILAEFVLAIAMVLVVVPLVQTVHAAELRQLQVDLIIMQVVHTTDSLLQQEHPGIMADALFLGSKFIWVNKQPGIMADALLMASRLSWALHGITVDVLATGNRLLLAPHGTMAGAHIMGNRFI